MGCRLSLQLRDQVPDKLSNTRHTQSTACNHSTSFTALLLKVGSDTLGLLGFPVLNIFLYPAWHYVLWKRAELPLHRLLHHYMKGLFVLKQSDDWLLIKEVQILCGCHCSTRTSHILKRSDLHAAAALSNKQHSFFNNQIWSLLPPWLHMWTWLLKNECALRSPSLWLILGVELQQLGLWGDLL